MMAAKKVTVARVLLPAGEELLSRRFDLTVGGLDAGRSELIELVRGSAALIADPTVVIDAEVLDAAGHELELVANFAVGYDNIDLAECSKRGIVVTNTPDVLTDATAELAVGLTLSAARQIPAAERNLRAGGWQGWDPAEYRGFELTGATIGVVGMGRIGRRFAELISSFGGEVLYFARRRQESVESGLRARRVEFEDLLGESDVVSLHLAATAENRHMINAETLALMKDTAILVNTARGSLVDHRAVADALQRGRLGAVGLDVFEDEPFVPEAVLAAPRAVLTPHIGSATHRARDEMARLVARNVVGVLDESGPVTPVSLE